MILFYSEYCPHCRMLLDTVKRHDANGYVKLACIENLRAKGQNIPPQIHSVPALLLVPSKQILYGKTVFDYLLLPGSGKLLVSVGSGTTQKSENVSASPNMNPAQINEPSAYSITSSNSLSDAFAMVEKDDHPMDGLNDRAYLWASVQTNENASVFPDTPYQEETRSKKQLPDLDTLRAQRDMELKQSDLNTTQLLPPSFTR